MTEVSGLKQGEFGPKVGHNGYSPSSWLLDGHLNLADCETKQYHQAFMVIPYPAVYRTHLIEHAKKNHRVERLLSSREFTRQLWVKDIHTQKVI